MRRKIAALFYGQTGDEFYEQRGKLHTRLLELR